MPSSIITSMRYGKIIDQVLISVAIALLSRGLSKVTEISDTMIRMELKIGELGRRIDTHEEKIKLCENLKEDLWRLESKRSRKL